LPGLIGHASRRRRQWSDKDHTIHALESLVRCSFGHRHYR
jgi:hypothetical protein